MSDPAILNMQRAIINYINAVLSQDRNKARTGVVQGNRVIVGNQSYSYDPVVDSYFGNGSKVYCILPDSGRKAAVVGVAQNVLSNSN